mgnify:CR=1 FL=1
MSDPYAERYNGERDFRYPLIRASEILLSEDIQTEQGVSNLEQYLEKGVKTDSTNLNSVIKDGAGMKVTLDPTNNILKIELILLFYLFLQFGKYYAVLFHN